MGYKKTHVYAMIKRADAGELVERKKVRTGCVEVSVPSISSSQSKPIFKAMPTRDPLQPSSNIIVFSH